MPYLTTINRVSIFYRPMATPHRTPAFELHGEVMGEPAVSMFCASLIEHIRTAEYARTFHANILNIPYDDLEPILDFCLAYKNLTS